MLSFTTSAVLSLAIVGTLAGPVERRTGLWHHSSDCMSEADAQQVVDNYAQLISAYTVAGANAALTEDFVDYSESVNSLINTCPQGSAAITLPLLSPTFSNRTQFEAGQGQQAPINFKQLGISHGCKSATVRWETTNTAQIAKPRPVVGIILLETEKAPAGSQYPWLINTVYSEFDAAAWLQNLEEWGICGAPNASSPPIAAPSAAASAPAPAPTAPASSAASATPSA